MKKLILFLALSLFSFGQINVKLPPYNARGDGKIFMDGSMTTGGSSSITFNCSVTCYLSGFMMNINGTTAANDKLLFFCKDF